MAKKTSSTGGSGTYAVGRTAGGVTIYDTFQNYVLNRTWYTSPKVGGKFVRPNPMSRQSLARSYAPGVLRPVPTNVHRYTGDTPSFQTGLDVRFKALDASYASCYAKFVKEMKQSAESQLGVAIAGRRQTADLLRTYAARAAKLAKASYTDLLSWMLDWTRRYQYIVQKKQWRRMRRHQAEGVERLSSEVLAFKFGFQPLVTDVSSAAKELVRYSPENNFVKARRYEPYRKSWLDAGCSFSVHGRARTTIAARVEYSDANAALANRLGLINPAAVLWDLIPWSWVIGMFANVSQVLNSWTDLVGYRLTESSTTQQFRSVSIIHDPGTSSRSSAYAYTVVDCKKRTVGTIGGPPLMVRIPEPSVGLAITALALAGQRINQYGRLVERLKGLVGR